jgi:hypothetical protein
MRSVRESMLVEPRARWEPRITSSTETEGGNSLVGEERCRLRIHHRTECRANPITGGVTGVLTADRAGNLLLLQAELLACGPGDG